MRDYLLFLGVPPKNINIQTHLPKVDWEQYHRIDLLAKMRNEGMKPLYDTAPSGLTYDGKPWSAVIYYNDVYLSGTHFLELLHQHYMQDADMTCGWDHAGRWFYDGWVGRDMSGDLYTPFPVKEEDKDLPQKVSHTLLLGPPLTILLCFPRTHQSPLLSFGVMLTCSYS
jgi:alpha-1,3-mannosyltransferase